MKPNDISKTLAKARYERFAEEQRSRRAALKADPLSPLLANPAVKQEHDRLMRVFQVEQIDPDKRVPGAASLYLTALRVQAMALGIEDYPAFTHEDLRGIAAALTTWNPSRRAATMKALAALPLVPPVMRSLDEFHAIAPGTALILELWLRDPELGLEALKALDNRKYDVGDHIPAETRDAEARPLLEPLGLSDLHVRSLSYTAACVLAQRRPICAKTFDPAAFRETVAELAGLPAAAEAA